jgi:ubiquitin carboxyl-terminal hydrolase 14
MDNRKNIPVALKMLYADLNKTTEGVPPLVFLQVLRGAFPQYAEQGRGGYLQQDAEEVMRSIVQCLKDGVPLPGEGKGGSFVEKYMSYEMTTTTKCDEAPEEEHTVEVDTDVAMRVNISGGIVTYMTQEMLNSVTEKIEKISPTLERSATYTKEHRISRLPKYLLFNFVRFQWKASESVRAKILKVGQLCARLQHDLTFYFLISSESNSLSNSI